MRVIVGCEFSQIVTKAFRDRGHEAYSCDLLPTEGNPEWHFQEDILKLLEREKFDLGIFHPPCTHLAVSGMRWFKVGCVGQKPIHLQDDALLFVKMLMAAPILKICVENPVSIISTRIKKPSQIINPYQFGHPEQKKTCLWLKNLPLLKETDNVYTYMQTLPIQKRTRIHWLGSGKSKERSRSFKGIAEAMAAQWG